MDRKTTRAVMLFPENFVVKVYKLTWFEAAHTQDLLTLTVRIIWVSALKAQGHSCCSQAQKSFARAKRICITVFSTLKM